MLGWETEIEGLTEIVVSTWKSSEVKDKLSESCK
jgi:hypothetical protein